MRGQPRDARSALRRGRTSTPASTPAPIGTRTLRRGCRPESVGPSFHMLRLQTVRWKEARRDLRLELYHEVPEAAPATCARRRRGASTWARRLA